MSKKWLALLAGMALGIGLCGCRGAEDEEGGEAPPAAEDTSAKAPFPKEKATASITGKVMFEGDPPVPKALRIQGDVFCEHHAAGNGPKDESLLVNDDKTLRNVIVYVSKGADEWKFDVPKDPVVMTQKNCTYTPHAVTVQVGQAMQITSGDDTTHNVHFIGQRNREFNLTQKKGQVDDKRFTREEVGTAFLKCDVHSWMRAQVGIVGHPFHAVTGVGGTFDLGKLPPGEYEVTAWHETLGEKKQTVTLEDGKAASIEISFAMK